MEDRWGRVQSIYDAALQQHRDERPEFIRQACGNDRTLSLEVASLVRAHENAGSFLEGPAPDLPIDELENELPAGGRIGPYRVVEVVGRGGMAVVYLAERDDTQFQQRVAVKLIKAGLAAGDLVRRFRQERQILANLRHPNIARLLDGGATDDGMPYYVMEYVAGERITSYCDAHRLPVRDRVRLFCDVCAAVEFAHRNLIVHRDIKPSNVLVEEGVPKLLDFGIAKLLAPAPGEFDQDLTSTGLRVLTPAYSSPEQVRGGSITTATDVYSLGVVLYELLSGYRPYDVSNNTPEQAAHTICTRVPERLSACIARARPAPPTDAVAGVDTPQQAAYSRSTTPDRLARELSGDLENIVAKAMAKEAERRYASAAQLREDLARYLQHQPVLARPDSIGYRTRRFVERHWAATLAAALVVIAVAGGTVATAYQASVARAERTKAERRFKDLHKLANSFLFEFDESIRNVQGTTAARALIVRRALEYLNQLASESAHDAGLQRDLAAAYEKVSDIQGNISGPNLGDQKAALDSGQRARSIRESLVASDPGNVELQRELASSYRKVAELTWLVGDPEHADQTSKRHLALIEQLHAKGAADDLALGSAYTERGWILMAAKGDEKGLGENARKAVAILDRVVTAEPQNLPARAALGRSYEMLAGSLGDARDKWPEITNWYRRSLDMKVELMRAEPQNPVYKKSAAAGYNDLGHAYQVMGQYRSALECHRAALRILEEMAAADPGNRDLSRAVAIAANGVGSTLVELKDGPGAIPYLNRSIASLAAIPDQNSIIVPYLRAMVEYHRGRAYILLGRNQEARHSLEHSVPVLADFKKRGIAQGEEAALADRAAEELAKLR